MTNEQMNALLEEAKPSIIEALKKEMINGVCWDVKNKAQSLVAEELIKWFKAEIMPEVQKQLVEEKAGLLSIIRPLSEKMADEITKAMIADFSKKLSESWTRKKIFEAMFS